MKYRRLFLIDEAMFYPTGTSDFVLDVPCDCASARAGGPTHACEACFVRAALLPAGDGEPDALVAYGLDGPVDAPLPVAALFDGDGEETDAPDEALALVAQAGEGTWLTVEVDPDDPWAGLVEETIQ